MARSKHNICIMAFLVFICVGWFAWAGTLPDPEEVPIHEHAAPWLLDKAWAIAVGSIACVGGLVVYAFLDLKDSVKQTRDYIKGVSEENAHHRENMWAELGRLEREKMSIEMHKLVCKWPRET